MPTAKELNVQIEDRPDALGKLCRALAHAAFRLGEANININYADAGSEPATNDLLIFLGVTQPERAARILDQAVVSAAGT